MKLACDHHFLNLLIKRELGHRCKLRGMTRSRIHNQALIPQEGQIFTAAQLVICRQVSTEQIDKIAGFDKGERAYSGDIRHHPDRGDQNRRRNRNFNFLIIGIKAAEIIIHAVFARNKRGTVDNCGLVTGPNTLFQLPEPLRIIG